MYLCNEITITRLKQVKTMSKSSFKKAMKDKHVKIVASYKTKNRDGEEETRYKLQLPE